MVKNLLRNGKTIFLRKQTNILSAAFVIMVAVLLSRVLGLLRDRFLADRFFVGPELRWQLDVYFAAFRFPDMIFELLVIGALSAAFIPVFSEYLEKNKEEAYDIASSIINIITLFFGVASILLFVFAPQLCKIIAPGYDLIKLNLLTQLTRLMLFAQIILCVSSFVTGIIQSNQRFLIPALAPVLYNVGIIFGILFLKPVWGIQGVAVGVILGALLHLLIQIPIFLRLGFVYHPLSWNFRHPAVKEVARLMIPRSLALAVGQVEATVAVTIATFLSPGSLSIFYFAQHLMNLPIGLFGATIGQAALPILSQNTAQKNYEEFKKNLLSSLFQVFYLVLPVSALFLVLRVPIVRLALGTKNFPWQATLETGRVLALFVVAIFSQSLIQILVRGFYALHDTKKPLIVGSLAVAINVGLSLVLTFYFKFGVLGLAAATSLASLFQLIGLFIMLDRRVGGFDKTIVYRSTIKMVSASVLTAIFLWVPMRFLDQFVLDTKKTLNLLLLTIIVSIVGLTVYILLSVLFKIEEYVIFKEFAKKIGRWRKILEQSDEMIDSPSL